MRELPFTKLHTCGNDFVVVDRGHAALTDVDWAPLAVRVCDRRRGIGADELVLLGDAGAGAVAVRIFNPDGSEAPMCGNALVAVGRFVAERDRLGAAGLTIQTAVGARTVALEADGSCRLAIGRAQLVRREAIVWNGARYELAAVAVGTVHAVLFVDDVAAFPVAALGPWIEHHECFAPSINVMFVERRGRGQLAMRPWERGGNGETLACGSGAAAAAYVASLQDDSDLRTYDVACPGGTVGVELGDGGAATIRARAERVFSGMFAAGHGHAAPRRQA